MNQINLISPYIDNGMWVFDDDKVGLVKEPFVAGADVMLTVFTQHFAAPHKGFNLLFSGAPFVGATHVLHRIEPEHDGWWYGDEDSGMAGWLCPALFKYFKDAPEEIHVQFKEQGELQ